jgi:hypothetical protein
MKWLYEPDQYKVLIKNYGCLPADSEQLKTWVADQTEANPGVDFQVFVDALDYLESPPNHEAWVPNYTKVMDTMGDNGVIGTIRAGTNTDVQAVLKAANDTIQSLLDEYWAANP